MESYYRFSEEKKERNIYSIGIITLKKNKIHEME